MNKTAPMDAAAWKARGAGAEGGGGRSVPSLLLSSRPRAVRHSADLSDHNIRKTNGWSRSNHGTAPLNPSNCLPQNSKRAISTELSGTERFVDLVLLRTMPESGNSWLDAKTQTTEIRRSVYVRTVLAFTNYLQHSGEFTQDWLKLSTSPDGCKVIIEVPFDAAQVGTNKEITTFIFSTRGLTAGEYQDCLPVLYLSVHNDLTAITG